MESELVWLEWNYRMLKIFIEGLDDVNSAYKQIKAVVKLDPSFVDISRRMDSNYAIKKRQYDENVHDIRDRIDRETRRIKALDAEGRIREAEYIQNWNNTVQEIEEYIRVNVPNFLKEDLNSSYQTPRTHGRSPISPMTNSVPNQNPFVQSVNSVNRDTQYKNKNIYLDSLFKDAPWLAVIFGVALVVVFGSIFVVGYVVLSILPLTSMILALEASTKVKDRINQPKEKNFFLYIRCLIPTILNFLALILFVPIVNLINDPALTFLIDGAGYINTAFFLQACFFGAVTLSFVSGLKKNAM